MGMPGSMPFTTVVGLQKPLAGPMFDASSTILPSNKAAPRPCLFSDALLHCMRSKHMCGADRSEEHTSELQSLMRTSYAVFCLQKTNRTHDNYIVRNK